MPLLGSAAMLLSFDIEPEAIAEHDRWHTHEHLPERLSIPGFLRGTRWTAEPGSSPRYLVVYEVEALATLASDAYLARLNDPTPWTRKMMPRYRGMHRGLCAVLGSFGLGQGGSAALLRFAGDAAHRWLLDTALTPLGQTTGLAGAHLLRGAQPAAMTDEQRIRGADQGVDSAVLVTGYDAAAVAACAEALCGPGGLADHGATGVTCALYRCACTLTAGELGA
jgi:hypothetical protein